MFYFSIWNDPFGATFHETDAAQCSSSWFLRHPGGESHEATTVPRKTIMNVTISYRPVTANDNDFDFFVIFEFLINITYIQVSI